MSLVFFEQAEGKVSKSSLAALKCAQELKSSTIIGVCLGNNAKSAAESLKSYGLSKIFYSENPVFSKYLPAPYAQACFEAINQCNAERFILAATSQGKDFAPRVAVKLNCGQVSDIVAINTDGTFRRPIYAGNAFADVKINTKQQVITVRASAFDVASVSSANTEIVELSVASLEPLGEVIKYDKAEASRPELAGASVVVSAGRALESAENFEKYIYPLADVLGAAVGASRAAVDSGYAPNDWQVGQTGKIVAPNLYIAIGISGAIQHLAGMKDSKVIVAINKDSEAPIFEIADYGLVADLYEVLPKLTEAIKNLK